MVRLSAYLFEETKNTTYQEVAQLSLNFVINHLWNGSIVYDGLDLHSCQTTIKPFSLNQAWFVEGEVHLDYYMPSLSYHRNRACSVGKYHSERYTRDAVRLLKNLFWRLI